MENLKSKRLFLIIPTLAASIICFYMSENYSAYGDMFEIFIKYFIIAIGICVGFIGVFSIIGLIKIGDE